MKKAILTTLAATCLTVAAFAQLKYGHVNTGIVLESLPETAAADSLLRLYQDSLQFGFAALETEFREKVSALETDYPELTPIRARERQQELGELQAQMQAYQQEAARMFELRRGQYLTPIVDRVMGAIRAFAKTNGYTIVFDSSLPQAMLYVDDAQDLTPEVQAAMQAP